MPKINDRLCQFFNIESNLLTSAASLTNRIKYTVNVWQIAKYSIHIFGMMQLLLNQIWYIIKCDARICMNIGVYRFSIAAVL